MKVTLGTFGRYSLQTRLDLDPVVCMEAALLHYAVRLRLGSEPVGPPPFLRDARSPNLASPIELSLEPELAATLEREARRYEVSPERMVQHALLVFIADLGGGP